MPRRKAVARSVTPAFPAASRRGSAGVFLLAMAALVSLAPGPVRAEASGQAVAQARYLLESYAVQEGLVQDQATVAHQDPTGYIWFGTMGGLSRYDGRVFRNYSTEDGLPDSLITALFTDRSGNLWVGTPYGPAILRQDRFVPVPLRRLSPKCYVHAIQELPDGTMAFATREGLVLAKGEEQTLFTTREGLPGNVVITLALGLDGTLWIGSAKGLCAFRDGRLSLNPLLNEGANDFVVHLSLDPRDGSLVITRLNRIQIMHSPARIETFVPELPAPGDLQGSVVDRTGTLWSVSFSQGIFYLPPGGQFIRIGVENGLRTSIVTSVMADYEDNVWFCTDAGVEKLSDRSVSLFSRGNGLLGKDAWFAAPFGGQVLVGSTGGLQFLTESGLKTENLLPESSVVSKTYLPDGSVLLGTENGLFRFTGAGKPTPCADKTLATRAVWKILPIKGDQVLVGSSNGLWSGRHPTYTRIPFPNWVKSETINDILSAGPERWWLATDKGILQMNRTNGVFRFSRDTLMPGQEIQCFLPDGEEILVGTIGNGLFRWAPGSPPQPYRVLPEGASPNIWALHRERSGTLWVGTSKGIFYVREGRTADFNAEHGIPYSEVSGKESLFFDNRQVGYFATTAGLIIFRPGIRRFSQPPRGCITQVQVGNAPPTPPPDKLVLSHTDSLTIKFRCFSFLNEDGNRYQIRLEGVDADWRPPQEDPHVFYPFLPPGEMVFRLRAVNSRGQVTEILPAIRVSVTPPFTQTIYFYLLLGGCVAAVVFLFIGYKLHLDRRERERLIRMVQDKTSELQRSEEKYRQLVEASPIGIAIVLAGKIVFVNPIFPRILKFMPEELVGREFSTLIHADDMGLFREYEALREAGDTSPHEYEIRLVCSDQSFRNNLLHANMTLYKAEPATLINVTDITEKKRMQEQLIHYQKLESIGTLAGGIAHDFNNIMQGIAGLTSLVRMQLESDSPFQSDLALIEDATAKAAVLTRKLLGFARKGKYVVTRIEIHEIVESMIAFSRRTIPLNIDFERRFNPEKLYIQGDRNQMEQVFLNLFLNSRDAMPGGGAITIATRLESIPYNQDRGTHTLLQGDYVLVEVEDNGCGIPPENASKIFDPFFTTKPQEKGSGLGMATVYGTVKNHLGYIYLDSQVGQGTKVSIYLPSQSVRDADYDEKGLTLDLPALADADFCDRIVLVVEDEAMIRQFLRRLLGAVKVKVYEAENGFQALQVFRLSAEEVDLVLLDVNMPVMDGSETLIKLKEIRSDLPVLILSGYGEDAKIQAMMKIGCQGFISKPIDSKHLLAQIGAVLKSTASRPPLSSSGGRKD